MSNKIFIRLSEVPYIDDCFHLFIDVSVKLDFQVLSAVIRILSEDYEEYCYLLCAICISRCIMCDDCRGCFAIRRVPLMRRPVSYVLCGVEPFALVKLG